MTTRKMSSGDIKKWQEKNEEKNEKKKGLIRKQHQQQTAECTELEREKMCRSLNRVEISIQNTRKLLEKCNGRNRWIKLVWYFKINAVNVMMFFIINYG